MFIIIRDFVMLNMKYFGFTYIFKLQRDQFILDITIMFGFIFLETLTWSYFIRFLNHVDLSFFRLQHGHFFY